jgi:hypothetical protein
MEPHLVDGHARSMSQLENSERPHAIFRPAHVRPTRTRILLPKRRMESRNVTLGAAKVRSGRRDDRRRNQAGPSPAFARPDEGGPAAGTQSKREARQRTLRNDFG